MLPPQELQPVHEVKTDVVEVDVDVEDVEEVEDVDDVEVEVEVLVVEVVEGV